jgi:hypothetical protein
MNLSETRASAYIKQLPTRLCLAHESYKASVWVHMGVWEAR